MITCNICEERFKSVKSLHLHLKAHGISVKNYYQTHYPRFDKLTGEPIEFKSFDQYIVSEFCNKKNMTNWMRQNQDKSGELAWSILSSYVSLKDIRYTYAPNYLYLLTHPRLPRKEFLTDYDKLIVELDLKLIQKTPEKLPENKLKDEPVIMVDTREQSPILFDDQILSKLYVGDYCLENSEFNNIFVDRKSESDFLGTMNSGVDRFQRELERARSINAYVFVLIESNMKNIYKNANIPFRKGINTQSAWANMRKVISGYSDVCQFVFVDNRENMRVMIPYFLKYGQELRYLDVQEYLGVE
jgi:DNA excision repair protein ERCC-4